VEEVWIPPPPPPDRECRCGASFYRYDYAQWMTHLQWKAGGRLIVEAFLGKPRAFCPQCGDELRVGEGNVPIVIKRRRSRVEQHRQA